MLYQFFLKNLTMSLYLTRRHHRCRGGLLLGGGGGLLLGGGRGGLGVDGRLLGDILVLGDVIEGDHKDLGG